MATKTFAYVYELNGGNNKVPNNASDLTGTGNALITEADGVLSGTDSINVSGINLSGVTFKYLGNALIGTTDIGFVATGSNGKTYLFTNNSYSNQSITIDKTQSETICFYPGTLVRTPDGEVAVETLKIGDLVLTTEGKAIPIRWMGRQTVSTIFADPMRVLPIRITAGALGENLPVRDLLVSPDHALLVDDILIHAGALVNGSSIRRESEVPATFTYYHVELADHSLILAEGIPAETFVDNVERLAFDNWAEHEALYGEEAPIQEMELPRAKSYRQVPMAIRQRLSARAALLGEAAAAA